MELLIIKTPDDLQQVMNLAVSKAFACINVGSDNQREKVEIIDTRELCSRLGITEPTVIRWRKKGKIPFIQIGSSVRFNYHKVLEALETTNKRRAKAC